MARAGGVTLGYLRYVLGLDTLTFKKGMTEAERDLLVMQKRFERVGSSMASLGNKLTVGLTLPLAAFATAGIREAKETAAAMAQVNAALTSMGPVAGRTSKQLEAAANAFEKSSLFEADQILQKVTANLLTFGNVAGKEFDRAQQAAINLSARLGQDLQASAIQVGKALNDPIKGMTALQRVGVQFTAQQKEQIKAFVESGQAAKAQGIILAELERQFGGAAAAAQNADPWNKATDAFKQLAETVGTALIPVINQLIPIIVSIGNAFASLSPETQKWVLIAVAAVAAAGPLLSILGNLILVLSNMGPVVLVLVKAWEALKVAFIVARIAALATLPALVPFLVPLAAIALAVGAVYLAWKNWDKIAPIVGRMVSAIKGHLAILGNVLNAVLHPVDTVTKAFGAMYDKVVGHSYVPDMVDEIAAQMARFDAVMVQPVAAATTKAAEAFRALQESTKGLLDRLFPEAASLNQLKSEMATLEEAMKRGRLTAEQYAAALNRLQTEGLNNEPIGVLDQGSLVPDMDATVEAIGQIADKSLEIAENTRDWRNVLADVATDLGQMAGDWLAAFVEGSAKLKDLWRGILAYAIRALSSQNGPLQAIFGGPRAAGGPVMSGKTYLVGEKGPELFTPGRSGSITSNSDVRGMGRSVVQNFNIATPDANSFMRNQRQIARDANRRLALA